MFSRTRSIRGFCVGLSLLTGIGASASTAIDACGQLEQSGACVLFRANGALYQLNTTAAFIAGDAVRVIGSIQDSCNSTCPGVAGCVFVGEITYCDGPVSIVGTLTATSGCTILADERDQLIQLDNVGGFALGERVIVSGEFNRRCEPRCSGIRRCMRNNSVVAAPPPPPPPPPPTGNDPSATSGSGDASTGGSGGSSGGTTGGAGSGSNGGSGGSGATGADDAGGADDGSGIDDTGGSLSGDGQTASGAGDGADDSPENGGAVDETTEPVNEMATFLCPVLGFAVPGFTLLGMARVRRRT
jgi:hypothetical protein